MTENQRKVPLILFGKSAANLRAKMLLASLANDIRHLQANKLKLQPSQWERGQRPDRVSEFPTDERALKASAWTVPGSSYAVE